MLTQLILNGFILGCVTGVLGLGFTVLFMGSRFFVFTFGASYVWAAYLLLSCERRLPTSLGAIIAVIFAALLGLALEVLLFRPVRRSHASPQVLMLCSVGAYIVLQNVISLLYGDSTRLVHLGTVTEGYSVFSGRLSGLEMIVAALSLAAASATLIGLNVTSAGRHLRAFACDPELARIVGMNVERQVLFSTALGSALGGLAGVLLSLDTGVVPTMGFRAMLWGVVASIIGGSRSVVGGAFAGLGLGMLQHLAVLFLPAWWQDTIVFALLIVFLILRPQGISGKPLRTAAV